MGFAHEFVGADGCRGRGRTEKEVMHPPGQRGARVAEMQVPSGDFGAVKGLEVEGRGIEHDGNRDIIIKSIQRREGQVSVFFQQQLHL